MTVIDCYKEDNPVINKKLREVSIEEGEKIAAKLFQILNERKDGIGLAANQVGIDAAVAVVNVIKPLVLINPKIISKNNEMDYYEGCLSYPGQGVSTKHQRRLFERFYRVDKGRSRAEGGTGLGYLLTACLVRMSDIQMRN